MIANKQKVAEFRKEQAIYKEKAIKEELAKKEAEKGRDPTMEELEKAASISKAERQAKLAAINPLSSKVL